MPLPLLLPRLNVVGLPEPKFMEVKVPVPLKVLMASVVPPLRRVVPLLTRLLLADSAKPELSWRIVPVLTVKSPMKVFNTDELMIARPLVKVMLPVPLTKPSIEVRSPVPSEKLMFLLSTKGPPNAVQPCPPALPTTPPKVVVPVPLLVTVTVLVSLPES